MVTIFDLQEAARDLVIGGGLLLWQMSVAVVPQAGGVGIVVTFTVPDRLTGRLGEPIFSLREISHEALAHTGMTPAQHLAEAIRWVVEHELRESLRTTIHQPGCMRSPATWAPYLSGGATAAPPPPVFYGPGCAPCGCPLVHLDDPHAREMLAAAARNAGQMG